MIECQDCGSTDLRKKGQRNGLQRYRCNTCGAWTKDNITKPYIENNIPIGELENYSPLILDDSSYPVIIGADAHIPYHDKTALDLFIQRGIFIGAKTIILNGDWLDVYQLSKFQKDPTKRDIASEIETARKIFEQIRKCFPSSRIIYKFGNHEDRYDAFLMRSAPELFKIKSIRLASLAEIGLKELGIECVENKRVIKLGHLYIIHGHEYIGGISAPVNPARGLYLRAKKSALEAHFHQTSEHTEPDISDDITTTWSIGCLCDLHPLYAPLNKWNHGFAEVDIEDGFFTVRNRRIIKGRLL